MTAERPRIIDVAREAKVSTGTVSRVMNGEASVSPARREAVLAAVNKLGYRPHPIARALRSGRTHTIGVTVRTLRNNSVAEFVETVLETVAPEGYAVSVSDTIMSRRNELTSVEGFLERNFDALVTLNPYPLRPYLKAHNAGAKVLSVFSPRPGRRFPFNAIHLDFDTPGARLLQKLHKLGHQRINFIAPPSAYLRNPLVHLPLVADGSIQVTHLDDTPGPHLATIPSDQQIVQHLLTNNPTAFIVRTESALKVLGSLQREGIDIPGDLSIALWGHASWRDLIAPPLDAVEIDYHQVGRVAGETLLAMLRDDVQQEPCTFVGHYTAAGSVSAPSTQLATQFDTRTQRRASA